MSRTSCGTFCPDVFSKIRIFYKHVLVLLFFVARDVIIFIVFVVIFVGGATRIQGRPGAPSRSRVEFGMVHGEVLQAYASLMFCFESFCLGLSFVATP
jgi:hypothetical protein